MLCLFIKYCWYHLKIKFGSLHCHVHVISSLSSGMLSKCLYQNVNSHYPVRTCMKIALLGLCFYQILETWQIVPGSSCSLSCDIFSSWTEISSSPDTWTPLTFRENSHSFLHPVQCRSRGSASDVKWKTSCFLGILIAAIKATSARTNFKCLQIDFLKELTLLGVISCAFSCKMKETIDLPWATENETEKWKDAD